MIVNRELTENRNDYKLFSEQITTRVNGEIGELRNASKNLMLKLQEKDQDLVKVLCISM